MATEYCNNINILSDYIKQFYLEAHHYADLSLNTCKDEIFFKMTLRTDNYPPAWERIVAYGIRYNQGVNDINVLIAKLKVPKDKVLAIRQTALSFHVEIRSFTFWDHFNLKRISSTKLFTK